MNKMIKEEKKFDGPRFDVVRKTYINDEGKEYLRDCVDVNDAVIVLPIDNDNNVYFVKQLREVLDEITLELPAGIIEDGEDPSVAGLRELREETGIIAKNIEFLGEIYPSIGYSNEKFYIYCATDLSFGENELDEFESISEVVKIPFDKCIEMVKNNELKHASLNVALSIYFIKENT